MSIRSVMRQYVRTDLEADRQVAKTLAALIIGGSLASVEIPDETGGQDHDKGGARPGASMLRPDRTPRFG